MGDTYCANAIIGMRIPRVQVMLRELERRNMVSQTGCERADCGASTGVKFCSECGRESIIKLHKPGEDEDTYMASEWFSRELDENGLTFVTANDVYASDEDIEVFIGIGCESDSTGYGVIEPGFINHHKLATTDVDNLKARLTNILSGMFGDLWEFEEENFGLWAVIT